MHFIETLQTRNRSALSNCADAIVPTFLHPLYALGGLHYMGISGIVFLLLALIKVNVGYPILESSAFAS